MTRLWLWLIAAGAVLLVIGVARASEITVRRWQLWEQPPGEDWRPRGVPLSSQTACDLDAASLVMVAAKGTRIACRRMQQ